MTSLKQIFLFYYDNLMQPKYIFVSYHFVPFQKKKKNFPQVVLYVFYSIDITAVSTLG